MDLTKVQPPQGADQAWQHIRSTSRFLDRPFSVVWGDAVAQRVSKPICRALLRCAGSSDHQAWLAATVLTVAARSLIVREARRARCQGFTFDDADLQTTTWLAARMTSPFRDANGTVVARHWKSPLLSLVLAGVRTLKAEQASQQPCFSAPAVPTAPSTPIGPSSPRDSLPVSAEDIDFLNGLADHHDTTRSRGEAVHRFADTQGVSPRSVQRRRQQIGRKLTASGLLREDAS